MTKFKKIAPWLIVTVIAIWVTLTESPYQKGGVSPLLGLMISCFVMFISVIVSLLYDNSHLLERLIVSVVFGATTLFIVSFIITPYIVDYFYSDKTWFLWETKHRLFINTVYYGLNVSLLTVLNFLYFMVRRHIRSSKKNAMVTL